MSAVPVKSVSVVLKVRQSQSGRRNALVVRRQFSFGDSAVGKEDVLWMTNHGLPEKSGTLACRDTDHLTEVR